MQEQKSCCCVATDTEMADRAMRLQAYRDVDVVAVTAAGILVVGFASALAALGVH
jgi:hypothetical protein